MFKILKHLLYVVIKLIKLLIKNKILKSEEDSCFKSIRYGIYHVFIMRINVKMPTIVGILTFMSRINFVLS